MDSHLTSKVLVGGPDHPTNEREGLGIIMIGSTLPEEEVRDGGEGQDGGFGQLGRVQGCSLPSGPHNQAQLFLCKDMQQISSTTLFLPANSTAVTFARESSLLTSPKYTTSDLFRLQVFANSCRLHSECPLLILRKKREGGSLFH